MVVSKDGVQARCATFHVQARHAIHGSTTVCSAARMAGLAVTLGFLAGCQSSSSLNPVNWWHQAQGGKIAQERPAVAGAHQPYPNLNTVPAKPAPPDQD